MIPRTPFFVCLFHRQVNLPALNTVGTLSHRENYIDPGIGTMKVYKRQCLKNNYVSGTSDWAAVTSKLIGQAVDSHQSHPWAKPVYYSYLLVSSILKPIKVLRYK